MRLSFDDEDSFNEVVGSLRFDDDPPSDPNSVILALQDSEVDGGSSMPAQERNDEDIRFNNSTSDLNSLALGGVVSTAPQEKSKDIDIIAA
jgi:hypothetical protein